MRNPVSLSMCLLAGACVLLAATAAPAATTSDLWWQRQADLEVASLTGHLSAQEIGGEGDVGGVRAESAGGGHSAAVPMLMSLVVPGAGELYLGKKIGLLFIAADAFSWSQVIHNAKVGNDKKAEYYDYATQHWSEEKLDAAYDPNYLDRQDANLDYANIVDVGHYYFDFPGTYTDIPLWVSAQADRREYFENLGKWDQFVFGWDDFRDPREFIEGGVDRLQDVYLNDPRTSEHREVYRQMRIDSNDAYTRRDHYVYLSIGLRVLSVLHVAHLEGLLFGSGGGGGQQMKVAGHPVQIFAEPVGRSAGVFGATVNF